MLLLSQEHVLLQPKAQGPSLSLKQWFAQIDSRKGPFRQLILSFLAQVRQATCYLKHHYPSKDAKLFVSVWFCGMLPLKPLQRVKQSFREVQGTGFGQETNLLHSFQMSLSDQNFLSLQDRKKTVKRTIKKYVLLILPWPLTRLSTRSNDLCCPLHGWIINQAQCDRKVSPEELMDTSSNQTK